jgi:hypothetical protein
VWTNCRVLAIKPVGSYTNSYDSGCTRLCLEPLGGHGVVASGTLIHMFIKLCYVIFIKLKLKRESCILCRRFYIINASVVPSMIFLSLLVMHHNLFFGQNFLAERVVFFTFGFYEGEICLSIDIVLVVLSGDILLFSAIFSISGFKKCIVIWFTIFFCDFAHGDIVSYLK